MSQNKTTKTPEVRGTRERSPHRPAGPWQPLDGVDQRNRDLDRQHYPLLSVTADFNAQRPIIASTISMDFQVTVTNNGSAAASAAFVELIEASPDVIQKLPIDPTKYETRSFVKIPKLYPHQSRVAVAPWFRKGAHGYIVVVVYDVVLDPKPNSFYPWNYALPEFHRQVIAVDW